MKDFIYELYQNDNFTLYLTIALVILIILFVIVFFFGKKDEKLEETKRLQKIELDTFKKEEEAPAKLEVKEETKPQEKEEIKPIETVNEEVTVTEFKHWGSELLEAARKAAKLASRSLAMHIR